MSLCSDIAAHLADSSLVRSVVSKFSAEGVETSFEKLGGATMCQGGEFVTVCKIGDHIDIEPGVRPERLCLLKSRSEIETRELLEERKRKLFNKGVFLPF